MGLVSIHSHLAKCEQELTFLWKKTVNVFLGSTLALSNREAAEARPLLPRVLIGLGANLRKFPIDFKIYQWNGPLQNINGLALSNMTF